MRSCLGPYKPELSVSGDVTHLDHGTENVVQLQGKHLMTIYYSQFYFKYHRKKPNLLFKCLCSNETLKNDDEFNKIL